jgi:hypothetical protein
MNETAEISKDSGGRPRKEINFDELEKLIGIGHTGEECANWFGIDYDTLNARIKEKFNMGFSDFFKKKNTAFKSSLRRMQFKTALGEKVTDEKGNDYYLINPSVTMLIWLGKQYLDQRDKNETELTSKDLNIKIEIVKPDSDKSSV